MKVALLTLALFGLNVAAAELKILKNYDRVTKRYSGVVVSTTEKPLALGEILSEKDGLCYVGDAASVQQLVESMAVIANATATDDLVYGKPVVEARAKGLALTVGYKTNLEKGEWSWANVPACVK